jgi:ketosteroid isomerase-like protein
VERERRERDTRERREQKDTKRQRVSTVKEYVCAVTEMTYPTLSLCTRDTCPPLCDSNTGSVSDDSKSLASQFAEDTVWSIPFTTWISPYVENSSSTRFVIASTTREKIRVLSSHRKSSN